MHSPIFHLRRSLLKTNLSHVLTLGLAIGFHFPITAVGCQISEAQDRIVYIGDSHSAGEFGIRLIADLKNDSAIGTGHIQRFAVNSSAANHWVSPTNNLMRRLHVEYYCDGDGQVVGSAVPSDFPVFSQLMKPSPRGVVIALGTNDTVWNCKTKDPAAQMKAVKKMLSEIPQEVSCAWIGPTSQNENGNVVKLCGDQETTNKFITNLKTTVQTRCTYIDSRTYSDGKDHPRSIAECKLPGTLLRPNNPDHIHFHGPIAKRWADCAALEVSRALSTNDTNPAHTSPKIQRPSNQ